MEGWLWYIRTIKRDKVTWFFHLLFIIKVGGTFH